ncbi:MAG: hypothetical protein V2A72_05450 [Candidatus Omnitrophota bacterium]
MKGPVTGKNILLNFGNHWIILINMKIRVLFIALFFTLLWNNGISGLHLQPVSCFADTCHECGGTGNISCPDCGGSGISEWTTIHGEDAAYGCEACGGVRGDPMYGTGSQGSGYINCPTCGGRGFVDSEETGAYSSAYESIGNEIGGMLGGESNAIEQQNMIEQQQNALEEQRRKAQEAQRLKQEEFEKNKQAALQRMKGITENEMGLKGMDTGIESEPESAGQTKSGALGLKPLFEKPTKATPVDTAAKGPLTLATGIEVQDGVSDPEQLKKDLLGNFSDAVAERTSQPNEQVQEIMRSFKMKEPPSPIKNITNLAPGDVILVAAFPLKDLRKAGLWNVGSSNVVNMLDRWGTDGSKSPASHSAIFLGERNGKRWYLDNTSSHGPIIMEEEAFLKEYGERQMDVATLVGQPLSKEEGDLLWKGAHEERNTTTYWPSKIRNFFTPSDQSKVCSETVQWVLLRSGRRVPDSKNENAKILGIDTPLNKEQFVTISPADFYANEQYFVVHKLGTQRKEEK